ncbi:MAG: amidohydrolase family protein [Nitrospinota bacterium]
MEMRTIDVHSHVLTPEAVELAKKEESGHWSRADFAAKESRDINRERSKGWSELMLNPDKMIRGMDRRKIDIALLSPPPYAFYHWAEGELGTRLARMTNDYLASLCKRFPDRFLALADVPLQNGEEAPRELRRAVKDLGLKGAAICSNINGRLLDEPGFDPFFREAEALKAFIFIHPHDVAGADRLQRFYLTNLIGNPLDTTIAAARLILGGTFERYPELRICLAHAGGHLPYIRGRLDHGWEARPEVKKTPHPPSYYFRHLYFDTITFYRPTLRFLAETVGDGHVLLGTDFPFDMAEDDPVGFIEGAGLARASKERILGGTAAELLGLS